MQQFVVPQFIDVEDKILGPITIRQFLILLVGGLIIFIMYRISDFALFITTLAVVGGSSLVLAFVKVNGQDFHYFLLNLFQTRRRPKLRIWNKTLTERELKELLKEINRKEEEIIHEEKKKPRKRHIRDLSLLVNTGGYYQPDLTPEPRQRTE